MTINLHDLSSLKNFIQSSIATPASFLIEYEKTINAHFEQLKDIITFYEQKKESNSGDRIYQIITDNIDTLFRYPLFMSNFHHNYDNSRKLQDLLHQFDSTLYVQAYNEMSTLSNSLNSNNLIPVLNYLINYDSKEYFLKCHNLVMTDYNNMYSSLSLEDKGKTIDLLNAITFNQVEGYEAWKKTQIVQGVPFSYDLNALISQTLNPYIENSSISELFKKALSNQEISKSAKDNLLEGIINYNWKAEHIRHSHIILNSLLEAKHYPSWINLIQKFNTILEEKNLDKREYSIPANYKSNLKDVMDYIVKEGNYDDLLTIKPYLSKDNYDFNYGAWYKNQTHDVTESPLYELALRGKKLEFNLFLEQYAYIDKTHLEYFKEKSYQNTYHPKPFLLKDEVDTLMNVLQEHQEYTMLDSLKQFKEKYCPTPVVTMPVVQASTITETKLKKNNSFFNLVLGVFSKNKENTSLRLNNQNLDSSATQVNQNSHLIEQVPPNHAEFIRELNDYAKSNVEKLNFLSRKVKINASIDGEIKKEICGNIDSILQNSLIVEKILEKQYSTQHVEEYVRYKSLTGKYFVQAVERYLNINTELKQELNESDDTTSNYLEQFRAQVNFIQVGLEEIKTQLKADRQNDLLMDMQTDTQLLRMKHGA